MTLHLIKLCVGCDSLAELQAWQKDRLAKGKRLEHRTRMTPKRGEELLTGGSLYWVIKGRIAARQRLLAIEPTVDDEGVNCCALVLDQKLVTVEPRAHRPFQGWRYLKPEEAPKDLKGSKAGEMPPELRATLAELGLL
jgi:hypothetical protein